MIGRKCCLGSWNLVLRLIFWGYLSWGFCGETPTGWGQVPRIDNPVLQLKQRVVKIYGSGGVRGLEAYQSGIIVSENGWVLTVWSHVLDTDRLRVVLDDGRTYVARLHQYNPRSELAILRVDDQSLPHFDLTRGAVPNVGSSVYVGSNLFGVATGDEAVSVMRGVVAAIAPLDARRGQFEIPYRDTVVILDVITNNPGAAGGAIIDARGNLIGLVGKEVQCRRTGTWLNFGYLLEQIGPEVRELIEGAPLKTTSAGKPGEPWTLELLGVRLIPAIVHRTPPYVDGVKMGSRAAEAGLLADDLIIEVDGKVVAAIDDLLRVLEGLGRDSSLRITVQRGGEFKTLQLRGR